MLDSIISNLHNKSDVRFSSVQKVHDVKLPFSQSELIILFKA